MPSYRVVTRSPLFIKVVSIYNDGCEINNCNNLNLYCVNENIKIVKWIAIYSKRSDAATLRVGIGMKLEHILIQLFQCFL